MDLSTLRCVGRWARYLLLSALLAVSTAQAKVTLDISPKGLMPDDRSVKVVVTARFEPGATIEDFSISYNGAGMVLEAKMRWRI